MKRYLNLNKLGEPSDLKLSKINVHVHSIADLKLLVNCAVVETQNATDDGLGNKTRVEYETFLAMFITLISMWHSTSRIFKVSPFSFDLKQRSHEKYITIV